LQERSTATAHTAPKHKRGETVLFISHPASEKARKMK
jgi:hypothetical protein